MKTDDDLLEALVRYVFETTGAPKTKMDVMMHQFRTQLIANLKRKPAKEMTDEEYAKRLEQMKKEALAFLSYLKTHDLPDLPGKFLGEHN